MTVRKTIPPIVWLAAIPILLLASLGHWQFWYYPRLRPAVPGDDLPSRIVPLVRRHEVRPAPLSGASAC